MTAMSGPYFPRSRPGVPLALLLIAILMAGLAAGSVALAGNRPDDPIRDIRSTPAGVTFRYVPPPAEIVPAPGDAGAERRTISIEGAALAPGGPGTWQVPVHTAQ